MPSLTTCPPGCWPGGWPPPGWACRYPSPPRTTCELTILGVTTGKSFLALDASGQARWYYEPAAGPATSPATLTAIIAYLLGAPSTPGQPGGLPCLARSKDRSAGPCKTSGLTVTLRVSEDLDSFEATTDIDITSPARPQLGTITLSDDAALDWRCDWRAAFQRQPRRPHRRDHPDPAHR